MRRSSKRHECFIDDTCDRYRAGKTEWHTSEFFLVREKLTGVPSTDAVLVDVGGGSGHDLAAFQKSYPDLGRLVLQDKQEVIADAHAKGTLPGEIEAMGHDFFTEQLVKSKSLIALLLTIALANIGGRCACILLALYPP